MKDSELRKLVLQKYYEKRREDVVSIRPQDFGGQVPKSEIARISQQLFEQGMIEFEPLQGDDQICAGVGSITARGVDAIEQASLGISLSTTYRTSRAQRLAQLRCDLAQVPDVQYPSDPWAIVHAWICKAIPTMRRDWPEFLDDFQQATTEPTWPKIGGVAGESLERFKWNAKRDTTQNAVQGILAFLDGLLSVGDMPHADAPMPLQQKDFVDPTRLDELRRSNSTSFDLAKLIRLCEELNRCFSEGCYFAVAMLTRAILDHVPPIFQCRSFTEVANNYGEGGKSFRECMQHLDRFSRKLADSFLHLQIRTREALPNATQIDSSRELDALLSEIVRIL